MQRRLMVVVVGGSYVNKGPCVSLSAPLQKTVETVMLSWLFSVAVNNTYMYAKSEMSTAAIVHMFLQTQHPWLKPH